MIEMRKEMSYVAVLYRLAECGESIPLLTTGTDCAFIEPILTEMHSAGLIEPAGERWAVIAGGRALLKKMVEMFDMAMRFEIFSNVDLARPLSVDECHRDNPGQVHDDMYDPRFAPGPNSQDLRLAMMTFVADHLGKSVDRRRIVFLQQLGSGAFKDKDFWFNLKLGKFYDDVEVIVSSAKRWTEIGSSHEESKNIMPGLYTAGMLEDQKRSGCECSACHRPLAVLEGSNKKFGSCPAPDCGASFGVPKPLPAAYDACGRCGRGVMMDRRKCTCGAVYDFRLEPGEVQQETVVRTWTENYDAVYHQAWLDPWDPGVNLLAFGLLFDVLVN